MTNTKLKLILGMQSLKLVNSFVILFVILLALLNCRGEFSDKPPLHLNPNMDFQPKEKPQTIARPIPEGTVAFGYEEDVYAQKPQEKFVKADVGFYTGKDANGKFLARIPIKVDKALLLRGQNRFNIVCATCHDQVGTSQSIVIKRGLGIPPPPDLASAPVVALSDGELFFNIKNGIRNMSGYGTHLEATDLWAAVAYVRAIQISRNASKKDVPADVLTQLQTQSPQNQ